MNFKIPEKIQVLNGSQLKMIAIITMLIDHIAAAVILNAIIMPHVPISKTGPYYSIYLVYRMMRNIGRIAFPIFCFFIVEGFKYTHDRWKYALRMLIFALISEIPFDLAFYEEPFYWGHQNVYWTLLIGILMMIMWEWIGEQYRENAAVGRVLQICSFAAFCGIAYLMKTDYNARGIILIFVLYLFRYQRLTQIIAGALAIFWEWPAVLMSFPFLCLYNGKRGKGHKYFFYIFYPLHLLLLFLLARLLYNRI